jgi:hypothetical protein
MKQQTDTTKRHITIRLGGPEFVEVNRIAQQYSVSLSDAMRWAVRAGLNQLGKKEIPDALRVRR